MAQGQGKFVGGTERVRTQLQCKISGVNFETGKFQQQGNSKAICSNKNEKNVNAM
jgi:hypothetical protein